MSVWESLTSGWAHFWEHRGPAAVAALNLLVNLITIFLLSLAGVPLISLMGRRSHGQPPFSALNPFAAGHHHLIVLLITGAVTLLVIAPFVLAATPATLIQAVRGRFSVAGYFHNGFRFFLRSLGLFCLSALILSGVMLASALVMLLLSFLFSLFLGKAGTLAGSVLGTVLLVIPWIMIFGTYLITMLYYLTDRQKSLLTSLSPALSLVRERFRSTLGMILVLIGLSLLAAMLTAILKYIPVAGVVIGMFVSSALNIIGYLAVMVFTGLIPEKR